MMIYLHVCRATPAIYSRYHKAHTAFVIQDTAPDYQNTFSLHVKFHLLDLESSRRSEKEILGYRRVHGQPRSKSMPELEQAKRYTFSSQVTSSLSASSQLFSSQALQME